MPTRRAARPKKKAQPSPAAARAPRRNASGKKAGTTRALAKSSRPARAEARAPAPDADWQLRPLDRPLSPNHEKLLDAALELISERGVAGTSLRALARELGMRQPSLYHYFKSKDDLVLQLVEQCARKMLATVPAQSLPDDPCLLPQQVAQGLLALWGGGAHPRYARFLFAVAIEAPEHRPTIARVFQELYAKGALFGAYYGMNAEQAQVLFRTLRMLASALGLSLIEEHVLFGLSSTSPQTTEFAKWLAHCCQEQLARQGFGPKDPHAAPRRDKKQLVSQLD